MNAPWWQRKSNKSLYRFCLEDPRTSALHISKKKAALAKKKIEDEIANWRNPSEEDKHVPRSHIDGPLRPVIERPKRGRNSQPPNRKQKIISRVGSLFVFNCPKRTQASIEMFGNGNYRLVFRPAYWHAFTQILDSSLWLLVADDAAQDFVTTFAFVDLTFSRVIWCDRDVYQRFTCISNFKKAI